MNAKVLVKGIKLIICVLYAFACVLATGLKANEPDKAEKFAADSMLGKKPGQTRDDNGRSGRLLGQPRRVLPFGDPLPVPAWLPAQRPGFSPRPQSRPVNQTTRAGRGAAGRP